MMEISLDKIGVEAVRVDPNFFRDMKTGDEKAVVLNDGTVVIYRMEKQVSKRRMQMSISVIGSISLDATMAEE